MPEVPGEMPPKPPVVPPAEGPPAPDVPASVNQDPAGSGSHLDKSPPPSIAEQLAQDKAAAVDAPPVIPGTGVSDVTHMPDRWKSPPGTLDGPLMSTPAATSTTPAEGGGFSHGGAIGRAMSEFGKPPPKPNEGGPFARAINSLLDKLGLKAK